MNLCGLDWLKFLKKNLIVRIVGSTIGKPVEHNVANYYHLIFIQKDIYTYLCCILYKSFIVLDFIYLLFLILSRCKLNLFVINLYL